MGGSLSGPCLVARAAALTERHLPDFAHCLATPNSKDSGCTVNFPG